MMHKKMLKLNSIHSITWLLYRYLLLLFTFQIIKAEQVHYTTRCICKCKAHTHVPMDAIYIESPFTNTSNCICPRVVLPKVKLPTPESTLYCLGCECKFETRSIMIIQIAVGIVITVISALVTYVIFLVGLQPMLNRPISVSKRRNMYAAHSAYPGISDSYASFEVHDSLGIQEQPMPITPLLSMYAIEEAFRKLKSNQETWKQQLEIQRSKIYS